MTEAEKKKQLELEEKKSNEEELALASGKKRGRKPGMTAAKRAQLERHDRPVWPRREAFKHDADAELPCVDGQCAPAGATAGVQRGLIILGSFERLAAQAPNSPKLP